MIELTHTLRRVMRPLYRFALLSAALLTLASCTTGAPTPDLDGPILTGFDSLRKSLATVPPTSTLDAAQIQATLQNQPPTQTLPPPTFTPTPTTFVGVFMGDGTFAAGNFAPVGTRYAPQAVAQNSIPINPVPNPIQNPVLAPTNPGVIVPPASGQVTLANCAAQPAAPFGKAVSNPTILQQIGCPISDPFTLQLVVQPFEHGYMIWRDTKEIYVVSTTATSSGAPSDSFWRVADTWNDTIPASDASIQAPGGKLQPVRGFGFVWRSNANVRNVLGWATANEQPFQATWQNFDRGWMMTLNNGITLAMIPADGPPPTTGIHFDSPQ
jgi:hypothetical protein